MKHRVRVITIIVAVVVFAVAYFVYDRLTNKNPAEPPVAPAPAAQSQGSRAAVPVNVYIAEKVVVEEGIRRSGILVANEEVSLTSEISGKVDRISFEEGSRVKAGDVLLKINDYDLQAQQKRAMFELNLLKDKLDRNRQLLEKDAISREAFDQIETDYNMVQADVELLQVRIDKTEIRAPFDGVIGFRYVSLGSYLQPNTAIATLVDNSKLRLEFYIPEKNMSPDLIGRDVTFTTVNYPSRVNYAKVYAVDPKIDEKTKSIALRAMYDNRDMRLASNMTADVVFGQKLGEAIAIPTQAVITEAGGKSVWVARDNKAVVVPIVTSTRTSDMVEVEQGLSVGDSVIITGLMQLREGSSLFINN